MSVTVSQYVLKVSSRCDLACDHCYVYEHADQSWRHKPQEHRCADRQPGRLADSRARRASSSSVGCTSSRTAESRCCWATMGCEESSNTLRSLIDPVARLDLRIHTNGVRLDESVCGLFREYGVRVGISLDGDRAANDRHRRFANGQSSFSQVATGARLAAHARVPASVRGHPVHDRRAERSHRGLRGAPGRGAAAPGPAVAARDLGSSAVTGRRDRPLPTPTGSGGSMPGGSPTAARCRSGSSIPCWRPGRDVPAGARRQALIRSICWSSRPTGAGSRPIR